MKKIVFILMIVLLGNGMCFAQRNSIFDVTSDTTLMKKQDSTPLIDDSKSFLPQSQQIPEAQLTKEKTEQQTISDLLLFLLIAVSVLTVLIVTLSVFVFIDRKKLRSIVIDTITDDKNYREGHSLQNWLNYRIVKQVETALQSRSKSEMQELRNKIEDLSNRLTKAEEKPVERPAQTATGIRSHISENISRKEASAPITQRKLYALNIIDEVFNKVSEQILGTPIFELTLSSSNTASFTVYKGAYATVLAAPEYLEGCDKQTLSDIPHDLQIIEGKASLQGDGKWKITQKANIKLV